MVFHYYFHPQNLARECLKYTNEMLDTQDHVKISKNTVMIRLNYLSEDEWIPVGQISGLVNYESFETFKMYYKHLTRFL